MAYILSRHHAADIAAMRALTYARCTCCDAPCEPGEFLCGPCAEAEEAEAAAFAAEPRCRDCGNHLGQFEKASGICEPCRYGDDRC